MLSVAGKVGFSHKNLKVQRTAIFVEKVKIDALKVRSTVTKSNISVLRTFGNRIK
jgi:hypothetical protein